MCQAKDEVSHEDNKNIQSILKQISQYLVCFVIIKKPYFSLIVKRKFLL